MKPILILLAVLAVLLCCSGADAAWGRGGCAGGQCGVVASEAPHPVAHAAAGVVVDVGKVAVRVAVAPIKATANVAQRVREKKPVRRFLFRGRCQWETSS